MLRSTVLLAAIAVAGLALGAGARTAGARACPAATGGHASAQSSAGARCHGDVPHSTLRRGRRAQAGVAARRAHRGERHRIARAIRRSRYTQGLRGKINVRHVRVSKVGRRWATARLKPKRRYRRRFDTATVVVHRSHHRWRVRTLGTAELGCVVHSRRVRRDLHLHCFH